MAGNKAQAVISIVTNLQDNFSTLKSKFGKQIKSLQEMSEVEIKVKETNLKEVFNDSGIESLINKIESKKDGLGKQAFKGINTTGIYDKIWDTLLGDGKLDEKKAELERMFNLIENTANRLKMSSEAFKRIDVAGNFREIVNSDNILDIFDEINKVDSKYKFNELKPNAQAKIINAIAGQYSNNIKDKLASMSVLDFYQKTRGDKFINNRGKLRDKNIGTYAEANIGNIKNETDLLVTQFAKYWDSDKGYLDIDKLEAEGKVDIQAMKRLLALMEEREIIVKEWDKINNNLTLKATGNYENAKKQYNDYYDLSMGLTGDEENYEELANEYDKKMKEAEDAIRKYEDYQQKREQLRTIIATSESIAVKGANEIIKSLEKKRGSDKEGERKGLLGDKKDKEDEIAYLQNTINELNPETQKDSIDKAKKQIEEEQKKVAQIQSEIEKNDAELTKWQEIRLKAIQARDNKVRDFMAKDKSAETIRESITPYVDDKIKYDNRYAIEEEGRQYAKSYISALTTEYDSLLNAEKEAIENYILRRYGLIEGLEAKQAAIDKRRAASLAKGAKKQAEENQPQEDPYEKAIKDRTRAIEIANKRLQDEEAKYATERQKNEGRMQKGVNESWYKDWARIGDKEVLGSSSHNTNYFPDIKFRLESLKNNLEKEEQNFIEQFGEDKYIETGLQEKTERIKDSIKKQIQEVEAEMEKVRTLRAEAIEINDKINNEKDSKAKTFGLDDETINKLEASFTKLGQALESIKGTFNITEESFSPLITSLDNILRLLIQINTVQDDVESGFNFEYVTGVGDAKETKSAHVASLGETLANIKNLKIDTNSFSSFDRLTEKMGEILNSLQKIKDEWNQLFKDKTNMSSFDTVITYLNVITGQLNKISKKGIQQIVQTGGDTSDDVSEEFKGYKSARDRVKDLMNKALIKNAENFTRELNFTPEEIIKDPFAFLDYISQTRGKAIEKYIPAPKFGKTKKTLYSFNDLVTKYVGTQGIHIEDPKKAFNIESAADVVNDKINLTLSSFANSDKGILMLTNQIQQYEEALQRVELKRKEISGMILSDTAIKQMIPDDIKAKAEETSQALHKMYSEGKQGTEEYIAAQIQLERLLRQSVINYGDGNTAKSGVEKLGVESVKEAELRLAELWKEQGSNFDLFALKNTDYYRNLYRTSAKDPTKLTNSLSSIQETILKGMGFEGNFGNNAINSFTQMTIDIDHLRSALEYIKNNYEEINQAAARLAEYGKVITAEAQEQAIAEGQVNEAVAETRLTEEAGKEPQDLVKDSNKDVRTVKVEVTVDEETLNAVQGKIDEIINGVNTSIGNIEPITFKTNEESIESLKSQVNEIVSKILSLAENPQIAIDLKYNSQSLADINAISDALVEELNAKFSNIQIQPNLQIDGSKIVINGYQPPTLPMPDVATPEVKAPISPAVVSQTKQAEAEIEESIREATNAVEEELTLFEEPTGQFSLFENLNTASENTSNTVVKNAKEMRDALAFLNGGMEGQLTISDYQERMKNTEDRLLHDANSTLALLDKRVDKAEGVDLSKYDSVSTDSLKRIREAKEELKIYQRQLHNMYKDNGEALRANTPNRLEEILGIIEKIKSTITEINDLSLKINVADSPENSALKTAEKEKKDSIKTLEKDYGKATKKGSYGYNDILSASNFLDKYDGVSTPRLEEYRTNLELLKMAKEEIEGSFDASGKLKGNYKEVINHVKVYKELLGEIRKTQEEIGLEGSKAEENQIIKDTQHLEKTYGQKSQEGTLWAKDINDFETYAKTFDDSFTSDNLTVLKEKIKEIKDLRAELATKFDDEGKIIGDPKEITDIINKYNELRETILQLMNTMQSANSPENNYLEGQKTQAMMASSQRSTLTSFKNANDKLDTLNIYFNDEDFNKGFVYTEEYKRSLEELNTKAKELKETLAEVKWGDPKEVEEANSKIKDFSLRVKELSSANRDMVAKSGGKLSRNIAKFLNDNQGITEKSRETLQEYLDMLAKGGINAKTLREIANGFTEIQAAEERAGNTGKTFFSVLQERSRSLVASLMTFMSFYRIIGYIKQGFNTFKEFDSALAEMQKVSNETISTLKEFQQASFDLADSIGTDALSLQQSVAEFMRLGQTLDEATDSAQAANILFNVSEFESAKDASTALIAMSQAYDELSNTQIIDVINKLGNDFPISTEGLATALQDGAASLTTAGNDFYEAAALVTAGNRITQDPSKVGKAMRTIALRLTGTEASAEELEADGEEVEGMIKNVSKLRDVIMQATKVDSNNNKGIDILNDVGAYKSTYDILLEIAEIYDEIVEKDKQYGTKQANLLLETIAGRFCLKNMETYFYRTHLTALVA